jgi:cytochrome c5
MKKLTLALAVSLAAALTGCGREDSAGTASPSAPTSTTVASTAPASTTVMGATAAGQDTYNKACMMCHGAGVAGAPKIGDKADWQPRIAQGNNTLYDHAIKGYTGKKGMMPPKGGNTALSDADVKAAVDFMVAGSK